MIFKTNREALEPSPPNVVRCKRPVRMRFPEVCPDDISNALSHTIVRRKPTKFERIHIFRAICIISIFKCN